MIRVLGISPAGSGARSISVSVRGYLSIRLPVCRLCNPVNDIGHTPFRVMGSDKRVRQLLAEREGMIVSVNNPAFRFSDRMKLVCLIRLGANTFDDG